jgi:hypothetical protein
MATLLRDPKIQEYDILALQEPWRNTFISTTHNPIPHSFHLCFPTDSREAPARVCFFVNRRIDSNRWKFTEHTRELSTLEITTRASNADITSKIVIHNVYNPPRSSDHRASCLPQLRTALSAPTKATHMMRPDSEREQKSDDVDEEYMEAWHEQMLLTRMLWQWGKCWRLDSRLTRDMVPIGLNGFNKNKGNL